MGSNVNAMLNAVTQYARAGQHQQARQLLWQVIAVAPHEERAWLMLASVARTLEEQRAALARALALNPRNAKVKQAYLQTYQLAHIRAAARLGLFVSYAHPDEVFAVELADDLRFFGVPVWLDITDMPDGSDWHEAVESALKGAGLMLLIGSPAALRADNVRSEARRFADAGKLIVPVSCQPADLTPLGVWYPPVQFAEDYSFGLQDLIHLLTAPQPAAHGSRKTVS